ncbi:O-methyltransferase gsfB [Lachnellula suecica]|uniref:O-methyltransferase gsfB n=1 Tax=Lachnellula suecica TaxID=602035 RepID=A0A8T9BWY6_9HELO|nr:O-methyltransferase gsfB [Lachnellula suecica]
MAHTRIVELASIIQEHTSRIDAYFNAQNIPTNLLTLLILQYLHDTVLDASDELTYLLLGPARVIAGQPTSIQAIQRFGMANSFPPTETLTFNAIAQTCSLSKSDTRRIIRHAMTYYIFRELSPGIVAHTFIYKALAVIPGLGNLADFINSKMWPSSTSLVDAMERWPRSEEPHEAGFNLANGENLPMISAIGKIPSGRSR